MKKYLPRIIILIVVVAGLYALYNFTPVGEWLNVSRLFENRDELISQVRNSYLLAAVIYIVLYIVVVALSIPGATVLTLLGGFFFGPFVGTLFVNIGATVGALGIFIAARYFLGDALQAKYGDKLEKLNREIDENGKNYMLTLRLMPIFPFFLINLLSGLTRLPAITFVWTTALGIIPGSFVYAYLGYAGTSLTADNLLTPEVIIGLVLLGVLSILPVAVKKIRKAMGKPPLNADAEEEKGGEV